MQELVQEVWQQQVELTLREPLQALEWVLGQKRVLELEELRPEERVLPRVLQQVLVVRLEAGA